MKGLCQVSKVVDLLALKKCFIKVWSLGNYAVSL